VTLSPVPSGTKRGRERRREKREKNNDTRFWIPLLRGVKNDDRT
jgi:hypothetical protein